MTKTSEKILVAEKIVHTRNGFLFTDIFANKYILVRTGPKANEMNEMVHTRGLLRWSLSLIRCCVQLHYGTVSEVRCPICLDITALRGKLDPLSSV